MIRKNINLLIRDPLKILSYLRSRLYILCFIQKSNIEVSGKLIIKGKPHIDIRKGSNLYIGDRVTLNSKNKGYHINMHSAVKILADRPNAIIRIGDNTRIHGTCIHAFQSITIGKNCLIAGNCQIIDSNGHGLSFPDVENRINTTGRSKAISIEDSVWIGANSFILAGVTIGQGAIISANSVVCKDIPSMVIAGGNPAVIIKEFV